MKPSETLLL